MISLDDVVIKELIGQGNYGEVYRAEDGEDVYAVKSFYVYFHDYSREEKGEIMYSLMNLMTLKHPSVLNVYDYEQEGVGKNHSIMLLTEYCPKTLEQELPKLDNTQKLIVIYGVAAAMKFLHEVHTLHYDLKISNVLLDKNNYPKLKDIGFKKVFRGLTKLCNQHEIPVGTAPETFKEDVYCEKSEVYSFGFLVYEILVGKPFEGLDYTERMKKLVKFEKPELPPKLPTVYEVLIRQCWEENPTHRPSFDDICEGLKKI